MKYNLLDSCGEYVMARPPPQSAKKSKIKIRIKIMKRIKSRSKRKIRNIR